MIRVSLATFAIAGAVVTYGVYSSNHVEARGKARPAEWGYAGERGPENWAALSPAYTVCEAGAMQSPFNIFSNELETSGAVKLAYQKSALRIAHHEHVEDIEDKGHTIQVTLQEGGSLTTERDSYQLLQFHFHTPSEHTIDGRSYPMEMHMVHRSKRGRFAVVAVLFEEGTSHPLLAHLVENLPDKGAHHHFEGQELDLDMHLPQSGQVYAALGSFTTPPCSENVEWLIMKEAQQASAQELDEFQRRLGRNNRPVSGRGHNRHVRLLSVNVELD